MSKVLSIVPTLRRLFSCFALVLSIVASPVAAQNIIKVTNSDAQPVVDNAQLLTQEQISDLRVRLRTMEDIEGTQIVVLTVPTTGDEDIFTFAQRTFTEWGIGQAKDNNGGLFVVASADRKMRIHTGYGLEGGLTDALSKRIIETVVAPQFRSGNYYGGISAGVDAIIAAVKGEYKAPPESSGSSDTVFYIIIILFALFFVYSVWQSNRRGGGGGGSGYRKGDGRSVMLPNIWTTGGGNSSGGWGHSGGDGGGGFGGFGGGFGGGMSGGGGASGSW